FTKTYLLSLASTAIDAGQNCVVDLSCATNNPAIAVNTDQRGTIRPTGSAVDIGAVEINYGYTTVRGQVLSPAGTPIRNATVEFLANFGIPYFAKTNNFGYFTLYDIPTEQTYILVTTAKGYVFTNQNFNVYPNVSPVTITSNNGNLTGVK
ncbi:MAG TPA: carboxypeptidase-like regulatory domain-containing protein, partial [Pyrinomonadaceae bacterium]|nr:carboxypeptidase-like regulatory domain-containing protein [Pyrinomonadaceae bacterium]